MAEHPHHYPRSNTSRERSRSPFRDYLIEHAKKRRRSGSPHPAEHRHDRTHRTPTTAPLPLGAQPLRRGDFTKYRALFAEYLDVQKNLDIDALSEREVKGRWKSFLGKWSRGELAEGWYDAETKLMVDRRYDARERSTFDEAADVENTSLICSAREAAKEDGSRDDSEEDGYGPSLPDPQHRIVGPAIPGLQDLQHRQELQNEDREAGKSDLRYERKQERLTQKERLEELVTRAEPGTHERQLEKKRETTAANHGFRNAKSPGAEEVGEGDLMGDQGLEGFRAEKQKREKVKNQREIRKEELLRARAVEREERMEGQRRKEEKTMQMLSEIAKQRFG